MKKNLLYLLFFIGSTITVAQDLSITTTVCGDANTVRITGPWWSWNVASGPEAVDNGNGTWTFTFSPAPTEDMEYLLVVDGIMESLIGPNQDSGDWSCTPITDQSTYANRQWILGSGNVVNTYGTCGDCNSLVIYGCMDELASNYNPLATEDDQSCIYPVAIPIDFEGDTYEFSDFDGGYSSVIANPVVSGINTSAQVVEHIRSGGQFWAGTYVSVEPIDFSTSSVINMKVYAPAEDIPVLMKLEASSGENFEQTLNTTVANEWEELLFDFTGQPSNLYDRVVVIFNMGTVGDGSAMSTYYFDDITFESGPVTGCTDPEALNYNPNATIDDGSCVYAASTLNITVTACSMASEVTLTGEFWGWDSQTGPAAVHNGDGTWTFTLDPAPTEDMQYLIIVDGVVEDLLTANTVEDNWSCTPITDYWSYANRLWTVGSGDVIDIYYGTCGECDNPFSVDQLEADMYLYPNPISAQFYVSTDVEELYIYDVYGKLIKTKIVSSNIIDSSDMAAGVYTVRLVDNNGKHLFTKLIKK